MSDSIPPRPVTSRGLRVPSFLIALLSFLLPPLLGGCTSTAPRKEPGASILPRLQGTSLDGKAVVLPDDLKGAPAILLVGYVQESQFDIDRWILGLKQTQSTVKVLEVPAISGALPRLAANFIDSGMRRGIPQEDWPAVVTVYSDADKIISMTGNESPRNARVMLLDKDGTIRWFFDRGYSADRVLELSKKAAAL